MKMLKVTLGAMMALAAASSAAQAGTASSDVSLSKGGGVADLVVSDAARKQVQERSQFQVATISRAVKGWVQMGTPWMQWKGQVLSPRYSDTIPMPLGNVFDVLGQVRTNVG